MKHWYGLTQDGVVIYLGEHDCIDSVDETERGRNCIWLWDQEAFAIFIERAAGLRSTYES